MQKTRFRPLLPIILLFIITSTVFIIGRGILQQWQVSDGVLLWGNFFLFGISLLSYVISSRGLLHKNPHVFMRSVYGSLIIKMFLSLIAAAIYIAAYKKNINKPALFTLMGLYLVYLFIEVSVLTRQLKGKTHG